MRYIFIGLFVGFFVNFFVFTLQQGREINGSWFKDVTVESFNSPNKNKKNNYFPLKYGKNLLIYDESGDEVSLLSDENDLFAVSGNGKLSVKFNRVGSSVEFLNTIGEPFLKMKSREYPYLSYNGKLILLMNGDQSRIRFVNFNGKIIGDKEVTGRMCTSFAFSKKTDFAGIGFLDGSFYFINEFGKIIYSDILKTGYLVKGIAISNNGMYGVVHYGNSENDHLRIVDIKKNTYKSGNVGFSNKVRTAIYIHDDGQTLFLSKNSILSFENDGDLSFKIKISPVRIGHAVFQFVDDFFVTTYPLEKGGSKVIIFNRNGEIFFSKKFIDEPFIDVYSRKGKIILRGTKSLFCYNLQN